MMKTHISKLLLLVVIVCIGFMSSIDTQSNLARCATASTSFVSGWKTFNGINNGTTLAEIVTPDFLYEASDFTISARIKRNDFAQGSRIFDFGSITDKYMYAPYRKWQ